MNYPNSFDLVRRYTIKHGKYEITTNLSQRGEVVIMNDYLSISKKTIAIYDNYSSNFRNQSDYHPDNPNYCKICGYDCGNPICDECFAHLMRLYDYHMCNSWIVRAVNMMVFVFNEPLIYKLQKIDPQSKYLSLFYIDTKLRDLGAHDVFRLIATNYINLLLT